MSLTINSAPAVISNVAGFNVTTSLVEDSSHVNLRIRGEVYHEGIVKAVVEKPKGIADFDFADILKTLIPGLKFAKDSGDLVQAGSIGSNLLTSWTSISGTYTTLTTTGNVINSAICTVASILESNNVAMTIGELYLLTCGDLANTGTMPYAVLTGGGADGAYLQTNKGILFMPIATGNHKINLGYSTNQNFSGTFNLHKITTSRTTVGGLVAPYFVKFTEVFENSSGVTTTDASDSTFISRYVNASVSGFAEYVLHDNASLFANKTIKNNAVKFYTLNPTEYLLCFFTDYVDIELNYSKDGGAYNHATHPVCTEGWAVIILNIGELLASVTTSLAILIKDVYTGAVLSSTITLYVDNTCIPERVVLEFDGDTGGKDQLAFEGLKDIGYSTARNYYTASLGVRKLINATGVIRQRLETLFKDSSASTYLKQLLLSETVKKLETSYVDTEVTVVTDSVKTDSSNLFLNQIEIEY